MAIEKKVSISKPSGDTMDGYSLMEILKGIYPVGSIYIGTPDGVMPDLIASLGTWVRVEGRVIVGVSDSDTDFGYNDTGGEKTHTLIRSELPNWIISLTARNTASNGLNSALPRANTSTGTSNNLPIAVNPDTPNGQPHNNLQPFKAKYMWERTA